MKARVTLPLVVQWQRDGGEYFINDVSIKDGESIINDLHQDVIEHIMENLEHDYAGDPKVKGEYEIDVEDIDVEVDFKYAKGTPDKYSSSHGNWLPGDPDDIDIKSISVGKVDVSDAISERDMDSIYDKIMDEVGMDESKRYKHSMQNIEKRLESKLRRGKIKSKLVGKDSKIPGFSYWFKK
jgi:hypothetical protein